MAKLLPLFLLLILMSCEKPSEDCSETVNGQNQEKPLENGCTPPTDPENPPVPEPDPLPGDDIPNEALLFDASVKFTNFEREQEEKVMKAIDIIKKVVGSSEFRDRVYNFTYKGEKRFVDNKGLSNPQIYQTLLNGKEDLVPEKDHEMDLDLELYYSWRNTVGYTYPNGLRIWMNTKFFNVYTPQEVAGNVFHEWTHKLGFTHATSYSVERDSSVPYALGELIVELGAKYQ